MTTTHTDVVAEKDPSARLGATRHDVGGGTRMGPATHLAAERERLAALTWEHFDARPLGATLGAELTGIDLTAPLGDAAIAEIRQALYDYKVIFFRDQSLTADDHVAFASRFGELEIHPFIPGNPGRPELVRFEKSAEVGGYENAWHHDVTWRECPSMGAVLHAIEVPAVGGDTLFSDMYAAYDSLDEGTRALVDTLTARHDFMKAFGHNVPADRRAEMRETYPVVEHPVAITHEGTGRKLLYVNRVFTDGIVGMDDDESNALLERFYREAETAEHQVRFHWEDDSIAFWDNRAVQHLAASDYWPQRRVMERASILGSRPVA